MSLLLSVLLGVVLAGICYSECPEGWAAPIEKENMCIRVSFPTEKKSYYDSIAYCSGLCGANILSKGYRCPHLPNKDFMKSEPTERFQHGTPFWLLEIWHNNVSTNHCEDWRSDEAGTDSAEKEYSDETKCSITRQVVQGEEIQPPNLVSCKEKLASRIICIIEKINASPFNSVDAEFIGDKYNWRRIMNKEMENAQRTKHKKMVDIVNSYEGATWKAVSAASAIADRICIHSNQTIDISVSAQQIISCAGKTGCHGGSSQDAYAHWVENGVVTGGEYGSEDGCVPYYHHTKCGHPCPIAAMKKETAACANKCRPLYGKTYADDLYYGKVYYQIDGSKDASDPKSMEKNIIREIQERGPVVTGFGISEDFVHYKSGVYQRVTGDITVGHGVKLIGWGVDNGVKYWLAANSWGRDWGDNGFFKYIRGVDHLSFESYVIAGIPAS